MTTAALMKPRTNGRPRGPTRNKDGAVRPRGRKPVYDWLAQLVDLLGVRVRAGCGPPRRTTATDCSNAQFLWSGEISRIAQQSQVASRRRAGPAYERAQGLDLASEYSTFVLIQKRQSLQGPGYTPIAKLQHNSSLGKLVLDEFGEKHILFRAGRQGRYLEDCSRVSG